LLTSVNGWRQVAKLEQVAVSGDRDQRLDTEDTL